VRIGPASRVSVAYELFDEQGRCVESCESADPLVFVMGSGEVPPALERALEGKGAGERLRVTLAPEEAFGAYDPAGLVSIPRDEIPGEELSRGDWVPVQLVEEDGSEDGPDAGDDEDEEFEMRVVEVSDDEVILDANHPLAGQNVTFAVEVLAVE